MLRNYIVLIFIFLLGCNFSTESKLANSEYISVWAVGKPEAVNIIEEPHLILELKSHWGNKKEVNSSEDIKFEYFIDGIVEDRLQYSSTGYLRVLSVNKVPIYILGDKVSFNSLIISDSK